MPSKKLTRRQPPTKVANKSNKTGKKQKASIKTKKSIKKPKNKSAKKSKSSGENKENRLKQIEKMWDTIFNRSDDTKLVPEPVVHVPSMPVDLAKKPVVIVLIHADWCGHCQRLKPEWKHMKDSLNADENNKIEFEEIESAGLDSGLDRISSTYDIKKEDIKYNGFPTIGTIRNKQLEMYGGERTSNNLLEWVRGLLV